MLVSRSFSPSPSTHSSSEECILISTMKGSPLSFHTNWLPPKLPFYSRIILPSFFGGDVNIYQRMQLGLHRYYGKYPSSFKLPPWNLLKRSRSPGAKVSPHLPLLPCRTN